MSGGGLFKGVDTLREMHDRKFEVPSPPPPPPPPLVLSGHAASLTPY